MEDPVAAPSSSSAAPAASAAARISAAAAVTSAVTSAPPALAPLQPSGTAAAVPEAASTCRRQLFTVELRPGESTIVSWKKLLKEAGHTATAPPVAPEPTFAAHAGPSGAAHPAENDPKDPMQPNRFNAVIEKIECLYMEKHSSDEEDLNDVPDEDQYDTEDSFIDDAELEWKVAAVYDCKIMEGVLSHQLKQSVIDGNKVVLSVSNADTKVDDAEFEENEVYAIDIVTSTGEGKLSKDWVKRIQQEWKVAAVYDCKIVEGVLSHQLKQPVIDGNKVVLSVSNADTKVDGAEFEENEVYALDIVTSTGEGKGIRREACTLRLGGMHEP
ncbi:hypothetical protein Zm00014a_027490 [Zea mays]|uniref:Uncharacterized protein n=1 Tax=Zea mays TaxID=4577 RepID=A0A3L6DM26_MAIZE|nr:hypothetical protein Zm00014a_027490 [Zea mays]